MNVILLLIDSLNRHDLSMYNPATCVQTPNLAEFARRGVIMGRHFAGSLPCMPARREITSGRREFPWRGWGSMEAFDCHLAERARRQGAVTMMVTDHYHLFEQDGRGYYEGFDGYEFIRGQEFDAWHTHPVTDRPAWLERINRYRGARDGDRYYRNIEDFRKEEEWFTPRVFSTACDWLRRNRSQKFFLSIDHFDVHEPFHCIEPYSSLYTNEALTNQNIWPPYQKDSPGGRFFDETTPEELAFIRSQYWGKITWVDKYIGRLMETLTELDLWEDTMVIVSTDHGHDLAIERERFAKSPPHHDSHAHLPLLVWHPECAHNGRTIDAVTSTVDLYATITEALGEAKPAAPHSRSFMPVLRGEARTHRDATLTGTFGFAPMIADARYSYTHAPVASGPSYWYSGSLRPGPASERAEAGRWIPGVDVPVWRIPVPDRPMTGSFLIEHASDPLHQPDLLPDCPELADSMRALMARTLAEDGAPPEYMARMGFA